jgi:hypothetical protein
MRCVALWKSDACARKMFGTKRCGFRSITGNQVLCTCTMSRWPLPKVCSTSCNGKATRAGWLGMNGSGFS